MLFGRQYHTTLKLGQKNEIRKMKKKLMDIKITHYLVKYYEIYVMQHIMETLIGKRRKYKFIGDMFSIISFKNNKYAEVEILETLFKTM